MPWKAEYADSEFGPFVVDDGTGTAYVDPAEAELMIESGDEFTVDPGEEPPPRIREYIERETDLDPVTSKRRKYTETRIGIGDPVLVAGGADADAVGDLEGSYTAAITGAGDAPRFYVTDDPEKGLGSRLVREAFASFLAAAILFGIAYVLLFAGG